MDFVVFVLATVLLAFRSAQAVIDFSSYAANGVTAYCKISRNDSTSSPYENLKQSNAGKCPVLIHLSVEIDSYTMTSSIFDVTWTAAVNRNLSTPGFRCKAINGKTAVRLASVYACKYGAACVGDEIIHPVTVQHREVHELDIQSGDAVELTSFRLEIPSTGTFMIIGEVRVEVGDSTDSKVSNIVRSIVFQRVPKQTTSLERVVSKIPQWTPQSSVVEITGAKLLSKLPSDTRNETVALVLIALVGLVAVAIFFVYGRRRNEAPYSESGEGVDVSRSDFVMQSPVPAFHNRPPVQPMPAFHYSGTGDVIPSETINVSSFRGDSEVSVSYSDDRESPVFSSLVDEMGASDGANLGRFRMDGATTYCKITDSTFRKPFRDLHPDSTGKCPVSVTMDVATKSFTKEAVTVDVTWNMTVNRNHSNDEFPVGIFENKMNIARDEVTACGISSVCFDGYEDVISNVVIKLEFRRFRDIGNAAVSGIGTNIVHNYVFHRLRVTTDSDTQPGTVMPSPFGSVEPALMPTVATVAPTQSTPTHISIVPTLPVTTVPPISDEEKNDTQNVSVSTLASETQTGNATNAIVLMSVAVVALVTAAVLIAVVRERR